MTRFEVGDHVACQDFLAHGDRCSIVGVVIAAHVTDACGFPRYVVEVQAEKWQGLPVTLRIGSHIWVPMDLGERDWPDRLRPFEPQRGFDFK